MAHQHDDERIPLRQVAELIPSQESPEWPRLLAGLESSERDALTRALRRARTRDEISLRHADLLLTAAGRHVSELACWDGLMRAARARAAR